MLCPNQKHFLINFMNTICKYVLLKLFVFPKLNCLTGSHVWLLTDYVHVCILCSSYLPFPQLFSFSCWPYLSNWLSVSDNTNIVNTKIVSLPLICFRWWLMKTKKHSQDVRLQTRYNRDFRPNCTFKLIHTEYQPKRFKC